MNCATCSKAAEFGARRRGRSGAPVRPQAVGLILSGRWRSTRGNHGEGSGFQHGDAVIVAFQSYFDLVQTFDDFVQPPVQSISQIVDAFVYVVKAPVYVVKALIEIVKTSVLHPDRNEQRDDNRQRHLKERLFHHSASTTRPDYGIHLGFRSTID